MDKKKKIIVGMSISIVIILFIATMLILTSKKDVVGVYKYQNQKIVLNEDKTCQFVFMNNLACNWLIEKNNVKIILSGYSLSSDLYHYETNTLSSISENYDSKEKCINKVNELKEKYDVLDDNYCKRFEYSFKAEIKDKGLLFKEQKNDNGWSINNDMLFEKIEHDD